MHPQGGMFFFGGGGGGSSIFCLIFPFFKFFSLGPVIFPVSHFPKYIFLKGDAENQGGPFLGGYEHCTLVRCSGAFFQPVKRSAKLISLCRENTGESFNGLLLFRKGELRIKVDHSKVEANIAEKGAVELSSNIGAGGRGMELSELRHKTVPFFLL